jgi:tetratricopeptide (TPR) repeat protein
MKNFRKVTILGILMGLGGCLFGCVAGDQARILEQQEIEEQARAREAAEINARLSECRKHLDEGDVDRARAILEGVLQVRPDHPEALSYWEKVNTDLFSTVYPGNTLSGIAAYYYDDGEKWSLIARANGIASPDKLKRYDRLRVPWLPACDKGKDEVGRLGPSLFGSSHPTKIVLHPVQEGDSLEALAGRYYGDKKLRFFLADYNRVEDPRSLEEDSPLKIPVFPPRKKDTTKQDRETIRRASLALEEGKYEEACRCFGSIPKGSPYRLEARGAMAKCRAEGASHYDRLGDEALQNSEPENACRYWKTALRLDPGRQEVRKKLEEAEDLVKTLDLLPSLP